MDSVTRMAADRLMRLLSAGDQLPEPRVILIDPDLVIGNPPAADEQRHRSVFLRRHAAAIL